MKKEDFVEVSITKKTLVLVVAIFAFVAVALFYLTFFKTGKFAAVESLEEVEEPKIVREPVVAGSFYPADKSELESMVNGFLNDANDRGFGKVRGLVVPHAGYIYSGSVAGHGFKQVYGIDTVIVIAPSHHLRFSGASVPNYTHYKTPLGEIKISKKAKELMNERPIVSLDAAHAKEHSLEVELPFLQKQLGEFELIPIVTGDIDPATLADVLASYIDENTLVVASSDLSHYYPYETAVELDKVCTDAIPKLDFSKMDDCEACGKIPVLTLMHIAKKSGWVGSLVEYKNSGDTAGTKDRIVGYAAIAFFNGVDEEEQKFLLQLSRETLETFIKNGSRPVVNEDYLTERLRRIQGCFVTLGKHGQLRGCIGHIFPQEPLYRCVIDNTINAAVNDIRFTPVRENELQYIEIDISVLSVPKKLEFDGPDNLLSKLTPLKDGVVIKQGMRQATYLPQVWDQFPTKESFLSSLCSKAGLNVECWKNEATPVEIYQAHVFKEH